jgi:hypothetical protein
MKTSLTLENSSVAPVILEFVIAPICGEGKGWQVPAYELDLDPRSALFWDIKQRRAVIPYGRFGRTCRSHCQESRSTRVEAESTILY